MPKTAAKHFTPEDAIEYDKVYKVRDLRLKFGYSQYELSWLLGYRDYYVRDVENPTLKLRYSAVDTNYLRLIFNCPLADIIAPLIDPPKWHINVKVKEDESGRKTFLIYRLQDEKRILYQTVQEEDKLVSYPTRNSIKQEDVNSFVTELMNTEYFDTPRTHLEIFKKSAEKFCADLKPLMVINAVAGITRQHSYPKLAYGEATETGRKRLMIINARLI